VAKPTGFLEHRREDAGHRPVEQRVRDFAEVELPLAEEALQRQATRCMDCGIPYCHAWGCPVQNRIPEFNDLVRQGRWREASENLHATNNFPELTGRVCPAPCEPACTLAINDEPVTIKHIEYQIAERAWTEGWVVPRPAERKTGRRVAVVGSGPAGLAAAQQLVRAGHEVVVFERDDRIGGLLRYGIPDFKLAKPVLERRLRQLAAEGVEFQAGVNVGVDISARYLRRMFDATLLATGATVPRDLDVYGRHRAANVHFAMDYLVQQNRVNAGEVVDPNRHIDARDQLVAVIGGGDTGSDCVGTAIRQGANEVHQLELLDEPPARIDPTGVWPLWPRILRTSSSHEEGCRRQWSRNTKGLTVVGARATELHTVQVEWQLDGDRPVMKELAGTEETIKVDLVLLACGFLHMEHGSLLRELGLALTPAGHIAGRGHRTSEPDVFCAGDCTRGASLVVHAINTGREAAAVIDGYLCDAPGK